MKKVFMTLGLTMFMGAAAFAQTQQGTGTQQGTTTDQMQQEQRDQDRDKDKKDIDKSDLPEEVRNAFDESQYSDWEVADVWEMDSNEQATAAQGQAGQTGQAGAAMDGKTYMIKVKDKDNDDQAVGLHYDASGTLLETKTDMDKKDKKDKKNKY